MWTLSPRSCFNRSKTYQRQTEAIATIWRWSTLIWIRSSLSEGPTTWTRWQILSTAKTMSLQRTSHNSMVSRSSLCYWWLCFCSDEEPPGREPDAEAKALRMWGRNPADERGANSGWTDPVDLELAYKTYWVRWTSTNDSWETTAASSKSATIEQVQSDEGDPSACPREHSWEDGCSPGQVWGRGQSFQDPKSR